MTDREFVEQHWPVKNGIVLMGKLGAGVVDKLSDGFWREAAELTRERLKQIAELKYELSLQRLFLDNYDRTPLAERNPHDHDADRDAVRRTVGRLDAALADLKKGMKETQA